MSRNFSGQRLRDARQRAGLTAEQLALCVGRSVWAVHSYERDRAQPPVNVAAGLADALDVDVDDLLTERAAA